MYDYLDLRQIKRLKELVPYKVLAPDADEIIEEIERLNNVINELKKKKKKYKEVIDKANNKLSQYKNNLKEYQEQDRINHQNISIGLVGVKIRAFEAILKEVE